VETEFLVSKFNVGSVFLKPKTTTEMFKGFHTPLIHAPSHQLPHHKDTGTAPAGGLGPQ